MARYAHAVRLAPCHRPRGFWRGGDQCRRRADDGRGWRRLPGVTETPPAASQPDQQQPAAEQEGEQPEEDSGEASQANEDNAGEPNVVKRPDTPPRTPDPRELQAKPDANGRVRFSFNGQPWPDVLQWLANVSRSSLDWQELPAGYLNLSTQRSYTIDEARDLINRHLQSRGYALLKRGEVLSVAKFDQIDPSIRVASIEEDATPSNDPLTRYEYAGVGRLAGCILDTTTAVARHADRTDDGRYGSWDRFGRQAASQWHKETGSWSIGHVRELIGYTYDYAGNRTSRSVDLVYTPGEAAGTDIRDQVYDYDGLHRLKEVEQGTDTGDNGSINTLKFAQEWDLDQLGNWEDFKEDADGDGLFTGSGDLDQTRTHNKANELLTQDVWANPAYDNAGNMTTIPKPTAPTTSYAATYDAWNRLVELGTSDASYEYDGLHRRVKRTEGSTTTHFFYNEQWQCLEERPTETGATQKQYVWHPHYIDALAVTYDGSSPSATKHFYLHDALFNVTGVLDNSGSVIERYHYDAYGKVTVLDTDFTLDSDGGDGLSDIGNEHLFTGRRLDPETGLQYSRHRYYHNQLGRWINRDPIGYADSKNVYEYVRGRPSRFVDSRGLESQWPTQYPKDLIHMQGGLLTPSPHMKYLAKLHCKCECASFVNDNASFLSLLSGTTSTEITTLIQGLGTDAYQTATGAGLDASAWPHSALRHCIASGLLARKAGCACSECLGNIREFAQYAYHGQSQGVSVAQIVNNMHGRASAGCAGDRHQSSKVSVTLNNWSMEATLELKSTEQIKQSCVQKLKDGTLLTGADTAPNGIDPEVYKPPAYLPPPSEIPGSPTYTPQKPASTTVRNPYTGEDECLRSFGCP